MIEETNGFFNGEQVGSTITIKEFSYDAKETQQPIIIIFYSKYKLPSI